MFLGGSQVARNTESGTEYGGGIIVLICLAYVPLLLL